MSIITAKTTMVHIVCPFCEYGKLQDQNTLPAKGNVTCSKCKKQFFISQGFNINCLTAIEPKKGVLKTKETKVQTFECIKSLKPPKKKTRKEITAILTDTTLRHIRYRRQSGVGIPEMNICRGQNYRSLRIDVLEIDYKCKSDYLIGYEIKSCMADFRSDKKMFQYLEFVNGLVVVFPEKVYQDNMAEINVKLQHKSIGIATVDENSNRAYLDFCRRIRYLNDTKVDKSFYKWILFKYARRMQETTR